MVLLGAHVPPRCRLRAALAACTEDKDGTIPGRLEGSGNLRLRATWTHIVGGKAQGLRPTVRPGFRASLEGIQCLTSLTGLDLEGAFIDDEEEPDPLCVGGFGDLAPLSGPFSLTELNLANRDAGRIVDLAPLAQLISLNRSDLAYGDVEDISPLSGLINLTSLSLSASLLRDITPLSALTNLVELDLGLALIEDISPLSGPVNLVELHLDE